MLVDYGQSFVCIGMSFSRKCSSFMIVFTRLRDVPLSTVKNTNTVLKNTSVFRCQYNSLCRRWPFDFILKTPPASNLLVKAAGVEKGSGVNTKKKAGKVTRAQLREIAERKLPDLTAASVEAAMNTIAGTARSMGIEIVG